MRKSAQSEGVLISILTLCQQLPDEVSAANVMHQVAEFHAAEGIIAEVLNDGATGGVTVRLGDLFLRERWKSVEKKRAELVGPHQVNNFLVSENGVRRRNAGGQE